ncbi:MAG: Spy/CpxP family protein refolding chaperone [Desulfobaccales bacterium]
MKRNWLLYLVIFSLALNLGTIGAFAYWRYQDRQSVTGKEEPGPMGLRDLWLALHLDTEQRQFLRKLAPEHRRQVDQIRQELMGKRQELFALLKGENPEWSAIRAKINEISAQQGQLEEEVVRFLLECRKHLRPEQQAAFISLVERRLCRPWNCGPMERPRWGHGKNWGGGPGPAPTAPPKSP